MGRLDDEQFGGKLLLFAGDFLVLSLLTAGCALSFLSGYGIVVDLGAIIAFCGFASAVSALLHRQSHPWGALLAVAVIAAIFWITWEDIVPTLEWLGQKMNLLPYYLGLPINSAKPTEEELMPVLLLLCAALVWLLGWTAVRARRWYLAALISTVLVLPAIQSGVLPDWGALMMCFGGWGTMLLTSLFGRRDPASLGRAQMLSLGGMAGLILLLVMALPMEGYMRPQWATDARTNLIRGVTRQLDKFFDLDELNSGIFADLGIDLSIPGEGIRDGDGPGNGTTSTIGSAAALREDLASAGPRRYSGIRILIARTDQPGGGQVYLRGGSMGRYTGSAWEWDQAVHPMFFPEFYGLDAGSLRTGFPELVESVEEVYGIDAAQPPSLYPAASAPDVPVYTMTIRDIAYRGSNFYPYRLMDGSGTLDEAGRLTLPWEEEWDYDPTLTGEEEYRLAYRPGTPEDSFAPLTGEMAASERLYRDTVIPWYLEVPQELWGTLGGLLDAEAYDIIIRSLEGMLETASEEDRAELEASIENFRLLAASEVTLEDFGGPVAPLPEPGAKLELPEETTVQDRYDLAVEAASRTAALLDAIADYDPDTPAMGEGEDFVRHFLQEKRGYCIHFATAGALLLRMQGIPTRYVTGYVANLNTQGLGTVRDSDAHAWVEIYIDGYGWHPVEMTPGYAGGGHGVDLAAAPEAVNQEEDEDTPDDTPEEEETPGQEEEEPSGDTPEEEALPEEAGASAFVHVLRILGITALVLAALGGGYALSFLPRKSARQDADTNRSVISAYHRYSRLRGWGGEENETLEELGRKAKFSQHTLTEEERAAAWDSLERAERALEEQKPKWKRLLLKLAKPLL